MLAGSAAAAGGLRRHLYGRTGRQRHRQRIRASLSLTGGTNCLAVTCTAPARGRPS